jgi:Helicase conserved C-terminal domain
LLQGQGLLGRAGLGPAAFAFLGSEQGEPLSAFRATELRESVQKDHDLLDQMRKQAEAVTRDTDPKLAALVEELVRIVHQAQKEGIDAEDTRRKRKVLIFSFYEDTIDWIEGHLLSVVESDPRLAIYRGQMASVAGTDSRNGVSRDAAVRGFAPASAGDPTRDEDRFDLLLCTDVLAEGMNLQDCRNIINYDLPWKPMRLVQRHGRVDRIGSPHPQVFLRTFFPDRELNRLLELVSRVQRKLAQAAASVGVEVSPIKDGRESDHWFSETREEIENLHKGNPNLFEKGGTSGAAQSGEEYRQDLRKGLQKYGDQVRDLPWKAGSGMARGKRRGHFFCARAGDRTYLRFVPFDGGDVIHEIGTCLRLIECSEETPRVVPDDLKRGAYATWQTARQHILDAWTFETDPANLQPRVPRINREIAAYLLNGASGGVDQERLDRCLKAVEAPCSQRDQNQLRDVFRKEYPSRGARVRAVVEEVERLGLQPFEAPQPLDPIRPEEIRMICWLAIESEEEIGKTMKPSNVS